MKCCNIFYHFHGDEPVLDEPLGQLGRRQHEEALHLRVQLWNRQDGKKS